MSGAPRPNVIYVFADQLRACDLPMYGNQEVLTPHLDQFASQGMVLANVFANTPVCTPSRATLLTGLYPTNNRTPLNDLPLPTDIPSIGTTLQGAGYRTGYIGKWHLDGTPRTKFTPPGPRRHGFEFWAAYNCSHSYYDASYYRDQPEPIPIDGYEPTHQTNLAGEFLATDDDRPFCLFLSWGPPHNPYDQVPQHQRDRYDPETLTLRPNVREPIDDALVVAANLDPRQTLADYYAAITSLDEEFGRLMRMLEDTGRAEDTIVIFSSDHGDMLWSQGRLRKQQPWEESVHVPMLVRWPGRVEAGSTAEGMASIVDVMPTILGCCGVDPVDPVDGVDRSPMLLDPTVPGAASVYLLDIHPIDEGENQGIGPWRAVRTERFTYAARANDVPWLLYDNLADPYQLHNLVVDPDHVHTRQRLHALLADWRDRTGDRFRSGGECLRALGLDELWEQRQQYFGRVRAQSRAK